MISINKNKYANDNFVLELYKQESDFLDNPAIQSDAENIILACRSNKDKRTKLDAFLSEYGLSNNEGVALMCLAESVLRIPDSKTRDLMISEKLSEGKWIDHLNKADSLFVNASTWGLLLAGKIVKTPKRWADNPNHFIQDLLSKSGEFPIRSSVLAAMQILSKEFVMARDFDEINKISSNINDSCSFDMLGEAARTERQALNYFESYLEAIQQTHKVNSKTSFKNGVSIKLSALYPRYETKQFKDVHIILYKRVLDLLHEAIELDVPITIDAEEQNRLSLSISLFERVLNDQKIKDWNGIGFAIQAYGKRIFELIDFFDAQTANRAQIHLRLVKGAYWDYEIKNSQLKGYPGYPVYSQKAITDLSYLLAAKNLFQKQNIYPKFATHNAHTIAAIQHLSDGKEFEMQRLYGMGELLYDCADRVFDTNINKSVYAPIGSYKDLLPYLVRRLLENGANSSFINRLLDEKVEPKTLATNPIKSIKEKNKAIALPLEIFNNRKNSRGFDMDEQENLNDLKIKLDSFEKTKIEATSIYNNFNKSELIEQETLSINNHKIIGSFKNETSESITKNFLPSLDSHVWSIKNMTFKNRSEIFNNIADYIESNHIDLIYFLQHEAGKILEDAHDEIREAIDFLRYYSKQIDQDINSILQGPTGEENKLIYNPKGNFLCISPWNFPVAIVIGQITAALAAGNRVILKPSEHTPILGYLVVKIFHENGIPKDSLLLVLGDGVVGDALTKSNAIDGVAFTGSVATAKKIQSNLNKAQEKIVNLVAETGGQNFMLVDSSALLEQVTDDVMRSAFNSSGQRCSALRALIIQEDIYDELKDMLIGAMKELKIGDASNIETDLGPIISKNSKDNLTSYIDACKKNGLNVIQPKSAPDGNYIPPTLIEINDLNVLTNEQFGPILHLVRIKQSKIESIAQSVNELGFGLTFGIHSRIESRIEKIVNGLEVGNIYVNRDMVGAVVGVQPFGGIGLSGSGFKAGGPNYLKQFMNEKVVSTNTVAFGGNTDLLNIEEE